MTIKDFHAEQHERCVPVQRREAGKEGQRKVRRSSRWRHGASEQAQKGCSEGSRFEQPEAPAAL